MSYAKVEWSIEDIKELRPNWTDEQCKHWLENNERYLEEVMIERGWMYIESELGDEDETEDEE